MDKSAVINLINASYSVNASGTQVPTVTSRKLMCRIRSIGMKESYTAMSVGRNPELCAELAEASEYHGEQFAKYGDAVYRIIRTYMKVGNGIELTLERTRDLDGLVV